MIKSLKTSLIQTFKRKNIAILLSSFLVFLLASGLMIYHGTKKTVALTLDGEERVVKTHATTIEDLMEDLEIPVSKDDLLKPSGNTELKHDSEVIWKPATEVTLAEDGIERKVWTTSNTVEELLEEQNIELRAEDKISQDISTTLTEDMNIAIDRAFLLKVVDGGKTKEVWSTSATVADFLKEQNIQLDSLDRVEPALDDSVKANSVINVVRVKKVTDVVEEPIDYAVISKKDSSLKKGTEKVVTEGVNGIVSNQFEIITENGKEVKRTLVGKTVVKEKQDKVIAVGTKTVAQPVSRGQSAVSSKPVSTSGSGGSSSGKEFYVSSTAYTANCNGCSGITATGFDLRSNPNAKIIAVDPRVIPLGSKVYVEGYGYAIAADKGSAIKGNKIDVFFANKSKAYQWGNRKVKIRIVN